jgi:pimeloyl-ACP methyl ester carboxylesterase
MAQVRANGIGIEVETAGDPANPALLLVMGLGVQMTQWPPELVAALVAAGYHVIRFDNRDIGLSEKFDHAGLPNLRRVGLVRLLGFSPRLPYTLSDMAADAVGVLDALGVAKAHVVGASMGGMISQHIAASYPERVLSLTSVMSSSGKRGLPMARPEAMAALMAPPPPPEAEAVADWAVKINRAIGSPAYAAPEDRIRARAKSDFARSYHPDGKVRQLAAIIGDGDRSARLKRIAAPTLVLHGVDDPLVPVECGRHTAQMIPGARLHEIKGMGHDLPLELVAEVTEAIASVAR